MSADERLLVDEFLGVYASGHASKAERVGQLDAGVAVAHCRLSEARLLPLDSDKSVHASAVTAFLLGEPAVSTHSSHRRLNAR